MHTDVRLCFVSLGTRDDCILGRCGIRENGEGSEGRQRGGVARLCKGDVMEESVVERGGNACGGCIPKRWRRRRGFARVMQCWRVDDGVWYELWIASEIRHSS